jgi:competence ComEA-like helix-hairpin-helix protein
MVLVDINTASKDELAKVTGLRSTLAGAIVDYREAHGPFSGVDDLLLVDGITRDLFDKIRDHLTAISPTGGAIAVTVRRRDPQSSGDYVGHRTDVAGTYTTGETRDRVPFITAAGLAADGTATLEVPARSSLEGTVTIRAIAPDGSVLAALTHAGINLPREVTLTTDPKVFGQTLPNTDPAAGRPTRLRGSVVDAAGQQAAGNLQVVIWGADAANPQDADFHALIVANTDGQGHFTGPYPVGVFTAAHATVGLPDGPAPVAIHLEDSAMPETVILVLDLPDVHGPDADCACKDGADAPRNPDSRDLGRADGTFSTDAGAGRCVDFTKPDRTLEEYSFSYVVRTTEPQIRGFTLDEPRRVPASVVGTYLPGLLTQTASTSITDAVTRPTVQQPSPVPLSFRASAVTVADSAPMAAETISPAAAQMPVLEGNFDAQVLRSLSRDPATFTVDTIATAARLSLHSDLIRYLGRAIARPR